MNKLIVVAIFAALFAGCQTVYVPKAREVKKKPQSNGIIAMPTSYRDEDRARAEQLMQKNCGALSVVVTDEGEFVVGQETKSSASTTNRDDTRKQDGNLFGIPLMSGTASGVEQQGSTTTTQLKEWQIIYNCEASPIKPSTKKAKR